MNKNKLFIFTILLTPILLLGAGCSNSSVKDNKVQKLNNEIDQYKKEISTLSDKVRKLKKENKNKKEYKNIYYISCNKQNCSIPRASGLPFKSTCIWSYYQGNGPVHYTTVTKNGLHKLDNLSSNNNPRVYCVDNQGEFYYGEKGMKRDI